MPKWRVPINHQSSIHLTPFLNSLRQLAFGTTQLCLFYITGFVRFRNSKQQRELGLRGGEHPPNQSCSKPDFSAFAWRV